MRGKFCLHRAISLYKQPATQNIKCHQVAFSNYIWNSSVCFSWIYCFVHDCWCSVFLLSLFFPIYFRDVKNGPLKNGEGNNYFIQGFQWWVACLEATRAIALHIFTPLIYCSMLLDSYLKLHCDEPSSQQMGNKKDDKSYKLFPQST